MLQCREHGQRLRDVRAHTEGAHVETVVAYVNAIGGFIEEYGIEVEMFEMEQGEKIKGKRRIRKALLVLHVFKSELR